MMALPQVRESAWLFTPGSDIPAAHVRLEERVGGQGWDLYVSDPASAPSQHVRYDEEADARAALERSYAAGRVDGKWRIWRDGEAV